VAHHLCPDRDKKKWSEEEDSKLFLAVNAVGKQWAEIARTVLPERSDLSIKNRHNSRMRREKCTSHGGVPLAPEEIESKPVKTSTEEVPKPTLWCSLSYPPVRTSAR
jgi:hypothetical protein